jgi:ATP-dependent helicase HrpB
LQLPIDTFLPDIVQCIERNTITLLEAEPGAGKTTRVPPALLRSGERSVYVLEPRRLAARLAAARVAEELGERLGNTVGYQVRFERIGNSQTRLWFLTEGVLTNRLLGRQELPQNAVVILDEFHERHLETDTALALLRDLLRARPDLRILIMSATLAREDLLRQLGDVPVVRVSGRAFPVAVSYTPASAAPLEDQVAEAVSRVIKQTSGHVLVFLPGAAEIRKAINTCEPIARTAAARLLPLYGELSAQEQDAAVAPSNARKIICSTNLAESSVTIDGVEAVIDSGLARVLSVSPWTGFSKLQIEKVSKASATQRAGRAGRTGPGMVVRLFSENDFLRRPEGISAEILRADLAQTLLQLAAADYKLIELPWIDEPPAANVQQAQELLLRLRALTSDGAITSAGRRMAKLPVHPRLARLVLEAAELGGAEEACEMAAKLAENRVRSDRRERSNYPSDVEATLADDLSFSSRRLKAQLREATRLVPKRCQDSHALEKAILCGFSDRMARRRGETLLLANGSSARLDRNSFTHSEFLVAVEIDDRSELSAPLVRFACPIEPDWLLDYFPERIQTHEAMIWNREGERVEQVNSLRYEQLTIDESRTAPTDVEAAAAILAEKAEEVGISRFADEEEVQRFLQRLRFAAVYSPELQTKNDPLASALRQVASGCTSFTELREAARNGGLLLALQAQVNARLVDEIAPSHVMLPSGRRARIEYQEGQPPSVASRLQDFFGMKQSPAVARGAVPLTVKLLAPNQRPVQVTTDLVSFWKNLYPQVRRELSRRYPKHQWPEVPA